MRGISGLRASIWRGYLAIAFRIAPQWDRENDNRVAVDHPVSLPADWSNRVPPLPGFALSGLDVWTAGTPAKNISFLVLPSSDATGTFAFRVGLRSV
jgi:hypothetical protein